MAEPVLSLRGVTKFYGDPARRSRRGRAGVLAVDDLTLDVGRGEIVALVGESGAGKSTVARLVLGLERADRGSVELDGTELGQVRERHLRRLRRRVHLVLQDPYDSLHPGLRIGRSVAEPLAGERLSAGERRARVVAALEEVGLTPAAAYVDRHPHGLSGGQRQRVAIARAVVARPVMVVADEPTSMLDASLRAGILRLLLGLQERHGTSLVVITHDLALARYVADRIAVMRAGRLVEVGDAERVIAEPRDPYTQQLIAASEAVH